VGAGVIIGSNVFNLAALLGLAAVVAGRIAFHRRVVLLSGVPAAWVAAATLLTVTVLAPAAGLALTAAVLVPYVAVLGMRRARIEGLPLPARWTRWSATPGPRRRSGAATRAIQATSGISSSTRFAGPVG
jgi:hypothetical protein